MNHWQDYPVGAMRHEALHGDRLPRCFAQRPANVYEIFERAVRQRGHNEIMVYGDERWTYAQAHERVCRITDGLAASGVRPGERVALLISNRPEFILLLFAVQRLGAIAVPIGVREQGPGVAYMLKQCEASAIIFDADLVERVPRASDQPTLRLRVALGRVDGVPSLQDVEAAGTGSAATPSAPVHEQDVAVLLYTSGTTGHPKGAMLTHLNIVHSVMHYEACMRLRADDRSALAVPASHVTGLIAIIVAMVHVGGAIVIVPTFQASGFIGLLAREKVSHTLMVPAMYNLCLLAPEFAGADLSAWRMGGYGGAPMPVSTILAMAQHLPGLTLLNAYGATETCSPATMMPAGQTHAHADSVGVALPCADIYIMDEQGRELAPGQVGELWIGGPMVVPGYWNNPVASAESFTAGYWHSGDLGLMDAEGFVQILDRKKDMLNRGGFKIYSAEVENVLMALPGVIEAAIVGRPCPVLGERVHAFIYAPELAQDGDAARAHCRAQLADYKVPESVTWLPTPLPRNSNGKVIKRALRAQLDQSAGSES
ncbi:class I adenylate-forming enzyme family protein [Rhodoferax sp. UBA5149]|uniref:class I adenylate-forming enzyme family protein n=1 Tax=Rhodoferax sp. UBA5149 TaxID=1947379 RepID=UPI0025E72784|nr:class I adenylate-forming enzyme family protein [Rhodoferax sp. UBA5149]